MTTDKNEPRYPESILFGGVIFFLVWHF